MQLPIGPRSLGVMLVATLAAGWFESVTQPNTGTAPQQAARAAVSRIHGQPSPDTSMPSTARLRARMASPAVPAKGRNPFVYGSRPATRPRTPGDGAEITTAAAVEPPAPALPVFQLSGIASNAENGTTVLTAILIDNGTMMLVKNGDKLSHGYSVVRVEEGSITIVDATGVTQTIRLP